MLKQRIKQDLRGAQKEQKEAEVMTLRMVLASILNKEKEKRYRLIKESTGLKEDELEKKSQLTEEEIGQVLFSEVKKRKESILEFEKWKRKDLAEKEKAELEILKKYLPEQLSEEEIKKEALLAIREIKAEDLKDMGKVMAQLMPKLKGKAQGGEVSQVVKGLLSSQDDSKSHD